MEDKSLYGTLYRRGDRTYIRRAFDKPMLLRGDVIDDIDDNSYVMVSGRYRITMDSIHFEVREITVNPVLA